MPAAAKHHHNMILWPPCFTVGMVEAHQTIGHASKRLDLCLDVLWQILTLPFHGAIGAMASFGHDTL